MLIFTVLLNLNGDPGVGGGAGGRIALTLQAEATTVLALSEARQNISNPWPYLEITKEKKGKQLHIREIDDSMWLPDG